MNAITQSNGIHYPSHIMLLKSRCYRFYAPFADELLPDI